MGSAGDEATGTGDAVPRHRHHGPEGLRRNASRVTAAIAFVVSLSLFIGFGWGWYEYRTLNGHLHKFTLHSLAGGTGDLARHPSDAPAKVDGTEQNILITGLDSRTGLSASERKMLHLGDDATMSTDTIMIIHVPADGKRATLISIPRDSFVDIPGYLSNKINAAFADGYQYAKGSDLQRQSAGADLLVQTVEKLTGLDVDHFVQVGFGGFYTITKAIGGLSVNLCHSVDDTVAHNLATGQGRAGSGFVMSAGRHELSPLQAFEFVRQRHNLRGGDLARERRQQYFLAESFKQLSSAHVLLNPLKLHKLIAAIDGSIYVDRDLGDHLTTLADQFVDLSAGNIKGYTIPTKGAGFRDIAGVSQSVEVVDPAAVRRRVQRILAGTYPGPSSSAPGSTAPAVPGGSTAAPSSSAAAPTEQRCID